MSNDKSKMKKALTEYGVRTARYFEISTDSELNNALCELKLPVVVKATDLQGSNGVFISRTYDDAINGFHEAMKLTKRPYCIVEEYIEGKEFGAQAFVYHGKVLFIMPHGDITYTGHTAIPIGHYIPLDEENGIREQVHATVSGAIRAIGLDNCAVNVDLIVRDGEVYVIELTGRAGANCLPELVEICYGIEYYKMMVAMAIGEDPAVYFNKRNHEENAVLAKMIFETEKSGIIDSIQCNETNNENICDLTFFKHPGDTVKKFSSTNDCIGQVLVKGKSLAECCSTIAKVNSSITINYK